MNAPRQSFKPRGRSAQAWARFRAHRRGWWSLWILVLLYALSLAAEVVCNDRPVWMRRDGRNYFPALFSYTQNEVLGNGVHTHMTDYAELRGAAGVRMLMPPFKSRPDRTYTAADIGVHRRMKLEMRPLTYAAGVQLAPDFSVLHAFGATNHFASQIAALLGVGTTNEAFAAAVADRIANKAAPAFDIPAADGGTVSLAPFSPRPAPPASVRVFIRSINAIKHERVTTAPDEAVATAARWKWVAPTAQKELAAAIETAKSGEWAAPVQIHAGPGQNAAPVAEFTAELETGSWPFRPIPGHPMGFDSAGRDVFAQVFYATRISITFGIALVLVTTLLGIGAGAIQGFFAGWVDIVGQRFTEIWAAMPFLYVIILLGNTLGRSFGLLLACYAMFNWIGSATYIRAEFLRLRTHPFVDAARCQGLSGVRIMFRHILPNALTPVITLLPFSLVGAIGSLAVLDYLGFGLPAGTPSWGSLLEDAQTFRTSWWLILYPSLALFTVMLLGVFIGEGMRDALDPKPFSKME